MTPHKVFVYATLKSEKILEKALGENHGKPMTKATLPGFMEQSVSYDHQSWPTLWAMGPSAKVNGEVFTVTDDELAKLDAWEDHYKRKLVKTSEGNAWVYCFQRPGLRVALGDVARFRSE